MDHGGFSRSSLASPRGQGPPATLRTDGIGSTEMPHLRLQLNSQPLKKQEKGAQWNILALIEIEPYSSQE